MGNICLFVLSQLYGRLSIPNYLLLASVMGTVPVLAGMWASVRERRLRVKTNDSPIDGKSRSSASVPEYHPSLEQAEKSAAQLEDPEGKSMQDTEKNKSHGYTR